MVIYSTQRFRCCSRKSKFSLDSLASIIKHARVCVLFHNWRKCCIYLCNAGVWQIYLHTGGGALTERGTASGSKRPLLSLSHQSEISEDELSVLNNHLSPANCKWQSSQGQHLSAGHSRPCMTPLKCCSFGQQHATFKATVKWQEEPFSFLAFSIPKPIKERVGPII